MVVLVISNSKRPIKYHHIQIS